MRKLATHLIFPFLTGFCFGMVLCLGIYLLNIAGIRSLVEAAGFRTDLLLEMIRFSCAIGFLSIATYFGMRLVGDR
jgi:hypothetical protein